MVSGTAASVKLYATEVSRLTQLRHQSFYCSDPRGRWLRRFHPVVSAEMMLSYCIRQHWVTLMERRDFITLLGGVAVAYPLAVQAQQLKKVRRIGVLWHAGSPEEEDVYLRILTKAFNDLGYVEGQNLELEHRFPAEQPERFRTLARELVDSKVDVIVAVTALGAAMLKQATSTIPIVFVLAPDPVGT